MRVFLSIIVIVLYLAPMFALGWYVGLKATRPPFTSVVRREVSLLRMVLLIMGVCLAVWLWPILAMYVSTFIAWGHLERYGFWFYYVALLAPFVIGIALPAFLDTLRRQLRR